MKSKSANMIVLIIMMLSLFLALWLPFNINEGYVSIFLTSAHAVGKFDLFLFFSFMTLTLLILLLREKIPESEVSKVDFSGLMYIKEIDGVRSFAAIMIVLFHWQPYGNFFSLGIMTEDVILGQGITSLLNIILVRLSQLGYLGVGVFIILSGMSLVISYHSGLIQNKSWRSFYMKRFIRIMPLYWLAVLFSFAIAFLFGYDVSFSGFAGSMLLLQNYIPSIKAEASIANQPLWFVPLIFALYVLFPLLLWIHKRLGTAGFLVWALMVSILSRNAFVWSLPMSRIGEFGLGMVIGFQVIHKKPDRQGLFLSSALTLAAVCLFILLVIAFADLPRYGLIQPVLAILLFLVLWKLSNILIKLNKLSNFIITFSFTSYALFLFHSPAIKLMNHFLYIQRTNILLGLLFALILSLVLYPLVRADAGIRVKLARFMKLEQ